MNKKTLSMTFVLFVAMMLIGRVALAADPTEVAPDMYKLQYENDRVRVLQVIFKPGQSIPEHSHPDHFVYVVEGGNLKITKSDGTVTDAVLKVGDIVWINAEAHSAVNTGSTVVRLLVTELKESKPMAAAPEAMDMK